MSEKRFEDNLLKEPKDVVKSLSNLLWATRESIGPMEVPERGKLGGLGDHKGLTTQGYSPCMGFPHDNK